MAGTGDVREMEGHALEGDGREMEGHGREGRWKRPADRTWMSEMMSAK